MFDFYLIESDEFDLLNTLKSLIGEKNVNKLTLEKETEINHILTHQRINVRFYKIKINEIELNLPKGNFVGFDELENLPKPIIIANYLKAEF
jgi:A/G-specific adenine glycosylase